MGLIAEEDSWNQWQYHMSAFKINGLHGNTSLFRSESETSELHIVSGSDWHVKCEQSWVRRQQQPLFDWLSVLLHYTVTLAPLWMWLSLSPTHFLHSEVPSVSCLPFYLFQISLYSFCLCLIHFDFISHIFSSLSAHPLPLLLRWVSVGQKVAF